ncbi:sulfur carrier protein ThiS [Parvularcula mediterranea]|uniref:sulfur carrier protein ThiS n=1 Tax=Parvularcula mediterranea TaxID=2732508 RepID=UPI0018E98438|nr:sulfur carrier protein ThiS [Parvularcula mediterranea]
MSKTAEQQSGKTLAVTVNGEERVVPEGTTVSGLLELLGVATGKVAVERNKAIVPRSTFAAQALSDRDQIEIVRFVGGG